jgi:hypothetical protein
MGQNVACGNSREPPLLTPYLAFLTLERLSRDLLGYDPKRLPSRRWASLALHERKRGKVPAQNFRRRRFHPAVQDCRIHRPEIDRMDQVALVEVVQ